jgi:hypothetical protein
MKAKMFTSRMSSKAKERLSGEVTEELAVVIEKFLAKKGSCLDMLTLITTGHIAGTKPDKKGWNKTGHTFSQTVEAGAIGDKDGVPATDEVSRKNRARTVASHTAAIKAVMDDLAPEAIQLGLHAEPETVIKALLNVLKDKAKKR